MMVEEIMDYDNAVMDQLIAIRQQIEVDKAELEQARQEQETAKAEQETAKADLKEQESQVDALVSQISAQQTQLEKAESDLKAAATAMDAEIKKKEKELAAQLAAQGTSIVSEAGFIWPLKTAKTITSFFGSRVHPITGKANNHTGIDIAAAGGTSILAAKSGVVITSAYNSSYGNYVVVSHGNGQTTLYAHMRSRAVSEGATVTQGQTIGYVGSTGSSTGNHLHFEVRVNGSRVDPLNYFKGSTLLVQSNGTTQTYVVP
jgi:murein DD-endopeptidase MepM/ murein hydrolase activator NlpD